MKKLTKFICVGDNHGDKISNEGFEALGVFLSRWKPQLRIHLGDCWDLAPWRKGVSSEEAREAIDTDLDAGAKFIKLLKPNVMMLGNHDQRAFDMLKSDSPDRRDKAEEALERMYDSLKAVGCRQVFEYKVRGKQAKDVNLFKYKKLITTHGMYAGNQTATRRITQVVGEPGCVVVHGHTHDFNITTIEHLSGPMVGISAMCLTDADQADYALRRPATTRWALGWVYGVIDEDTGAVKAWTAHKFAGGFVTTESFKIIDC